MIQYYQVYDSDGKDKGVISAESHADAAKKAREGFGDFPILVQMGDYSGLTISQLRAKKEQVQDRITNFIQAEIDQFSRKTKFQISRIFVSLELPDTISGKYPTVKIDARVKEWDFI